VGIFNECTFLYSKNSDGAELVSLNSNYYTPTIEWYLQRGDNLLVNTIPHIQRILLLKRKGLSIPSLSLFCKGKDRERSIKQ